MNHAASACSDSVVLDARKRVYYTNGLVLGADDFTQEQFYLLEKSRLHHRALHGFGTVSGLQVRVQDVSGHDGPEIVVEPGLAISPGGREVCVPRAQCATLNEWLARNAEHLVAALGSPPEAGTPLTVYLVLCPEECRTDRVPIPVGPCHSLDKSSAPSRVADDFRLELRLTAPQQVEEDAVRAFGEFLCRLEVTGGPGPFLTLDELLWHVRSIAVVDSPVASSPLAGSPPMSSPPDSLSLPESEAAEMLRAAFCVWATEVRPALLANACMERPDEQCVLLAELWFEVEQVAGGGWRVVGNAVDVEIHEERRPILLHTRLLQEWLLCRRSGAAPEAMESQHTFATLSSLDEKTVRAWIHYPDLLQDLSTSNVGARAESSTHDANFVAVSRPDAALNVFDLIFDSQLENGMQVELRFDAAQILLNTSPPQDLLSAIDASGITYTNRDANILAEYLLVQRSTGGATADHGDLSGLGDDDHPQYLLADGSRPLAGPWSVGGNLISNLPDSNAPDAPVRVDRAVKRGDGAGGDLSGTYPDPIVRALQRRPVRDIEPNPNDVLTWVQEGAARGIWQPRPLQPAGREFVVAAGHFVDVQPANNPAPIDPIPFGVPPFGDLQVFHTNRTTDGVYLLRFPAYEGSFNGYVVKGIFVARIDIPLPGIVEVLEPHVSQEFGLPRIEEGILVRVISANGEPVRRPQFMIEISQFR